MKTKTILLICIFMGIGIARVSAQTDVYKFYAIGGLMPITCDGHDGEFLTYDAGFTWLTHSQHGKWIWVKVVDCHWTATSSDGEVFKANEHDPGIEILNADGNQTQETGTWRVILNGDRGSHYKITWSYTYTFDPNTGEFLSVDYKLLEAKCH